MILKAYNAKYNSIDEIVATFVKPKVFDACVDSNNTLLLGPRGSGKTTILKMLQPAAVSLWQQRSLEEGRREVPERLLKGYHAVYVPNDSLVQLSLKAHFQSEPRLWQAFTLGHAAACLISSLRSTFQDRIPGRIEREISVSVGSLLGLDRKVKGFTSLETSIRAAGLHLRRDLVRSKKMPTAHLLDLALIPTLFEIVRLCGALLPQALTPTIWALCFDELELAHQSVRTELFEALRPSGSQNIVLKLALAPVNPEIARTAARTGSDFTPIKLWYSREKDWRPFAKEFFRREQGNKGELNPVRYFGPTRVARTRKTDYGPDSYNARQFRALHKIDPSFREYCAKHQIDVNNLDLIVDEHKRAAWIRKVWAVVTYRAHFLAAGHSSRQPVRRRSRKSLTMPFHLGWPGVVDVTEGNPRYLKILLNALLKGSRERAGKQKQAEAVERISVVARSYFQVLAYSKGVPQPLEFVTALRSAIVARFLAVEFDPEPPTTFIYDKDAAWLDEPIQAAVEVGALVLCDNREVRDDAPTSLLGHRLRLSQAVAAEKGLPNVLIKQQAISRLWARVRQGSLPY